MATFPFRPSMVTSLTNRRQQETCIFRSRYYHTAPLGSTCGDGRVNERVLQRTDDVRNIGRSKPCGESLSWAPGNQACNWRWACKSNATKSPSYRAARHNKSATDE